MLSKIEYVYGKDKNDEVQLLGAKVFSFDGEDVTRKEFYVGISYCVEELCSNINLANSIGIKDVASLRRRAESCEAVGIIYFPQAQRYDFLESSDTVIPYREDVEVALEETIAPFRNNTTTKEELIEYLDEKYAYLDQEDSRRELYGLPLTRQNVSAR